MLPSKRLLFIIPLFSLFLVTHSQETAPYSRFGLGETTRSALAPAKAMGGIGAAYRSPFHINFINPASYTSLRYTTFEGGINFINKRIKDGQTGATYKTGDGFFDYLALAFPSNKRKSAFSIGMIPFSKMSYEFREKRNENNVGEVEKYYTGRGRLYQLYAGGAYNFFKKDTAFVNNQLSLGLNVSYIFGKLEQRDILQFPGFSHYNTRVNSELSVNNVALNTGLQYVRQMKNNMVGIAGIYGFFPVVSASKQALTWDRFVILANGVATVDSVYSGTTDHDATVPAEAGAGFTIGKKNWMFGVEGNYQIWQQVNNSFSDGAQRNSFTIRFGGEVVPELPMPGRQNLFKKMSYRLGGYYTDGNLSYRNTAVSEYGITFGFGIPIIVFSNEEEIRLNLSFDAGKRGATENNLVAENFVRGYIGFTLSQRWFRKLKYD